MQIIRTPFRTVHIQATDHAAHERTLKSSVTRQAKSLGLGKRLTRRSHVIGNTVTVFDIYRKA
jgi:hypothetical protein